MPYKDKEAQRAYQREWVRKRRAEWLSDKSCIVCGSTENLHVDHIDPKSKLSHHVWSWSEKRRLAELAKCQVLCAVHHKQKTLTDGSIKRGTELRHKLTKQQVLQIRELAKTLTYRDIGKQFGIHSSTVTRIVKREDWAHI
jgi:5-methylcytosine-specific restriction endonuclease McrA